MDPIPIPRQIDDPVTLLLWQADEFVPFFLVLMLGMLGGQLLIALLLAVATLRAYRRFRDQRPDGIARDAAYWAGLWPSRSRSRPNPWIRIYYP